MKKLLSLLLILAWIALLGHLGILAYQLSFDVTTLITQLNTDYSSAITALIDFSSLDLISILRLVAVSLYGLSIFFGFIKILSDRRFFSALSILIHLSLVLIILLTILEDTSILSTLLSDLSSTSMSAIVASASLLTFVALSILNFIFVLLTLVPKTSKRVTNVSTVKPIPQEDGLADELKKFIVPNQVSVQVPPVVQPNASQTPLVAPLLQAQPVVQTPPLVVQQNEATNKARETVQVLKEKIRFIIRQQLAQRPVQTEVHSESTATNPSEKTNHLDEGVIRTMIQELFKEEIAKIKNEQKELVATLINEELIKYDALNREVIDSMINDKVDQLSPALSSVEQSQNEQQTINMSGYVTKEELANAIASLPNQTVNEEQLRTLIIQLLPTQPVQPTIPSENQPNKDGVKEQPLPEPDKIAQPEPINAEKQPEVVIEETSSKTQKKKSPKKSVNSLKEKEETTEPIEVPEVSVDVPLPEVVNEIPIEEQFKSVLPPNSTVTRTGKKKIIRIPFPTRMKVTSQQVREQYDELKNYILSFKVKSRVSNNGDMFRLHKEEYVKIVTAGKGLKLYFALDPKDYENSTIPVDDVSDKKIYKNLPLAFKVKSTLSVKRAKLLVDDLMNKKGLTQKTLLDLPWSKQFLD